MIYKRGKVWWFEFMYDGERFRESANTTNKQAAKDIEAARRTSLAKGEVGIKEKQPVPTVAEFSERFKKQMESEHAAKPKTLSYYTNGLRGLALYGPLQRTKLDHVEQVIDDFIAMRRKMKKRGGKTICIASVNRELEVLRHMLYVAQKAGIIDRVPRISRQPGEVGRERILDHAEESAYLAATEEPLRGIATILIDGGFRPEEVFRARWENIHLRPAANAAYGFIFNPHGKNKFARRNVSMTSRVRALLAMLHEQQGQPREGWAFPAPTKSGHVDSLKSQHRRALKDSGVKPFVLYSLRHTMLTRLGEAGADAFTIQKIAGHSSILTSSKYVHPTDSRLESAFTQLAAYNAKKEAELKAEQDPAKVQ